MVRGFFLCAGSEYEDEKPSPSPPNNNDDSLPLPPPPLPSPDPPHPASLLDLPGGEKPFRWRFERRSWKERHEEERKRLKEQFVRRREEYEQHIREQEEELLQQEMELKERLRVQTEEEEDRRKWDVENVASIDLRVTGFDYSMIYNPSPSYSLKRSQLQGSDSTTGTDGGCGDSGGGTSGVLSPAPSRWESEVVAIELVKGPQGLGFSILDFPVCIIIM